MFLVGFHSGFSNQGATHAHFHANDAFSTNPWWRNLWISVDQKWFLNPHLCNKPPQQITDNLYMSKLPRAINHLNKSPIIYVKTTKKIQEVHRNQFSVSIRRHLFLCSKATNALRLRCLPPVPDSASSVAVAPLAASAAPGTKLR
jgi:hypothetical protein